MSEKDPHRYDDILHLPHFVSAKRPHMSLHDRAAQFAPFAALTGYDDSIKETSRTTEREIELSESEKAELDCKLQILSRHIDEHPEITIRYFVPDERKTGGHYQDATFPVKRLDLYRRVLLSLDKESYPLDYILSLQGKIFQKENDPEDF